MPSYSGVWNLVSVYQAVAQGNWTNDTSIGVFGGGTAGSTSNVIDFLSLSSAGNAADFGDLATGRTGLAACASSTRGLFGGGAWTNAITYITFASQGNSVSFGNLTPAYNGNVPASFSNSTRGLWAGGYDPFVFGGRLNVIDYVTIASAGNATDFGDLTGPVSGYVDQTTGTASPTRGLVCGGVPDSGVSLNVIQYVTIATTGNATDFGDLTLGRSDLAAAASTTRAVVGGGSASPGYNNTIDYVTIASTGNATTFGDLTQARYDLASCSNKTNAVFGGGYTPTVVNVIDKVTIATTGNATDFGDLTQARYDLASCSNSGGGIA